MTAELYTRVKSAVKDAMRNKEKQRLATLRMITSEFKKIEVDERIELDDARILAVLDKMVKQRRDSLTQYTEAGRAELAEQEQSEIDVIVEFLPQPLTDDELKALLTDAIAESGAESARDMGKVMAIAKPKVQGRADMGEVSKLVKELLG